MTRKTPFVPPPPCSPEEALKKLSTLQWEEHGDGMLHTRKKLLKHDLEDCVFSMPKDLTLQLNFSPELSKTGPIKLMMDTESARRIFDEHDMKLTIVKRMQPLEDHTLEALSRLTWTREGNRLKHAEFTGEQIARLHLPHLCDETKQLLGLEHKEAQSEKAIHFIEMDARKAAVFFAQHGLDLHVAGQAKSLGV